MRCSKGHENTPGQRFCSTCGEALVAAQPAVPAGRVCTSGHAMSPGIRFCQFCGAPAAGVPAVAAAPSMPATPPGGLPPVQTFGFPTTPPPPPPKSGRSLFIGLAIAGVLVLGVIAVGLGSATQAPPTRNLSITYSVFGVDGCDLSWGYSDVPGSQVTVEMDGQIVATGTVPLYGTAVLQSCMYSMDLGPVRSDGDFYSVSIGRRGTLNYSQTDMNDQDWSLNLSLGS